MNAIAESLMNKIPDTLKNTALIRTFGFLKIPLLFYISPVVQEMNDEKCVVKIPLNRKTKNHLNSMYFGVLCAAADCAGGLQAFKEIRASKRNIALAFKDFQAEFLKRAESDTYFTCTQGKEIREFVQKVIETGERQHMPVHVVATCPDKLGDEPVAKFTLNLSLKLKE